MARTEYVGDLRVFFRGDVCCPLHSTTPFQAKAILAGSDLPGTASQFATTKSRLGYALAVFLCCKRCVMHAT